MSQQKFASNVIEKCLAFGDTTERRNMVNEMLGSTDDNEPLQVLLLSSYFQYTFMCPSILSAKIVGYFSISRLPS